jgi:hypothetical protein
MSDYQYEVFISYRRDPPVASWVDRYFYPELCQWLPQYLPPEYPCRIFIDKCMSTGTAWPQALKDSLLRSRCLLPVLSAPYFASDWCLSEFESMMKRWRKISPRSTWNQPSVVYPVEFAGGEYFPDQVKGLQIRKMHEWAIDAESFRKTNGYVDFQREMKLICKELAGMIQDAPGFDPTWPTIDKQNSKPHPAQSMPSPKFGGARIRSQQRSNKP